MSVYKRSPQKVVVHAYRGTHTACGMKITHSWIHTLKPVTCQKCLKAL